MQELPAIGRKWGFGAPSALCMGLLTLRYHPVGGSAGLEYDCGHRPNGVPSGQELAAQGQDEQHTLAPELRERRQPLGWSHVKPSGAHRGQPDRGRRRGAARALTTAGLWTARHAEAGPARRTTAAHLAPQ